MQPGHKRGRREGGLENPSSSSSPDAMLGSRLTIPTTSIMSFNLMSPSAISYSLMIAAFPFGLGNGRFIPSLGLFTGLLIVESCAGLPSSPFAFLDSTSPSATSISVSISSSSKL